MSNRSLAASDKRYAFDMVHLDHKGELDKQSKLVTMAKFILDRIINCDGDSEDFVTRNATLR